MKKRVLMFCVSFFGYEKRIADALRDIGCEVDLYDERPYSGFLGKVCLRYDFPFYRRVVRHYFSKIVSRNQSREYDYILVVKGEAVNEEEVKLLRQAYPKAVFILYLWDSVINIPNCEKKIPLYDRVFTFDPEDAKKHGIPMLSIPYGKEYISLEEPEKYAYDVAFIGTMHSDRPRIVKTLEQICQHEGKTFYAYCYCPHKLVYLIGKITNPNYRYISRKDVHFEPLSVEKVRDIYNASKCVLDIEHYRQSGTTTRPIEVLPMKKKIITTNQRVMEFPFYCENNFYLLSRKDIQFDSTFCDSTYVPVDEEYLKQYSPECFARTLLYGKEK